ncbi:MAG TPA: class I SAM-dependent methyltransferase [Candidatus Binatia bacterium]|nr:class I SAM-dependent methyltransferase [Candidatus Binatia bacterium]
MTEKFWGRGVADWVGIQEPLHRPLYDALLDAFASNPGDKLLDAGCGSGVVCVLAAERGLDVTGVDASPAFIDVARERCPAGQFSVGDLREALPFEANSFHAVVFSNSLQFVPNASDAMREVARILRPGGRVAIAVFDAQEKCDGSRPIGAILSFLATPPPGSPGPFALSNEAMLEALVRGAGLDFEGVRRVETPWVYPDLETARRAFLSAGPSQQVRELGREVELRAAIDAANSSFRQPDGTYLLQNAFMFAIGRKPEAS